MNFYTLSGLLNIDVETLYNVYKELFPHIKVYGYTVGLNKQEIERLKLSIKKPE